MAFKGPPKKGLECADGTSFPIFFYEFESKPLLQYFWKEMQ